MTFRFFRKQPFGTVQMGHVPPYILGGLALPPLFGWDSFTSGISQLPQTLTLNGVDIAASLFYVGDDATASEWVARQGANLPVTGAGVDPVVGQRTPFTDGTQSVLFGGAGNNYYECADTTTGNMGGANAVTVCVFYNDPTDTGSYLVAGKKGGLGAGNAGWYISRQSVTQARFVLANGISGGELSATRTIGTGWVVLVVVTNANGSSAWGQCMGSGVGTGTFSNPPVGPWDGSAPLRIGGGSGLTTFNRRVAFVGQWLGSFLPADASATAIMNDINKDIQQRITGVYPQYFGGSPLCADTPRTSGAYCLVDDGTDVVAELVSTNFPRIGRQAAGVEGNGYVGERAAGNSLLWSQDLSNAAWTKVNGSISGTAIGPDKESTLQVYDSDGTLGVHGVSQAATLTAAPCTFAFFFRERAKSWAYMDIDTIANTGVYFDLANGVVGTVGAAVLGSGMERWTADGLWRCWVTFTGTAASHTHRALAATGDGGIVYAGPSANELDMGWGGVELLPGMTTPVRTTTATATRNTDSINFDVAGNYPVGANPRTVVSAFAARPYTPLSVSRFVSAIIDATVEYEYHIVTNTNKMQASSNVASVSQFSIIDGGATLALDATIHIARTKSAVGDVNAYLDGVSFGTAAPASLSTPDRIYIAGSTAATSKLSGVMPSFRIYDQAVAPGEQGTGTDT